MKPQLSSLLGGSEGIWMVSWNHVALVHMALLVAVLIFSLVMNVSCEMEMDFEIDRSQCEEVVGVWASNEQEAMVQSERQNKTSKENLQDLLFFLHVPRTGGRNYHFCFLNKLFTRSTICPNSYDHLRFDPKKSTCRFMSTHDDYSVLSRLPVERTSVITNLRHPTQRVLGAYEFTVEVSARFLRSSGSVLSKRFSKTKSRHNFTSTLDIWPWKHLVPWMLDDLFNRRDARLRDESAMPMNFSNVYDVPSHVIPLNDFIHHPMAHDLLHNGATFQVAGITNNSIYPDAAKVRRCANLYEDLGRIVLETAKKRLDLMLFVGLTENHKKTAELFASLVGKQIFENEGSLSPSKLETLKNVTSQPDRSRMNQHEYIFNTTRGLQWALDTLIFSYQECSGSMRRAQARRRSRSLEPLAPVNFTKETRDSIFAAVFSDILKLNSLDVELYDHARKLFQEQERSIRMETEGRNRPVLVYESLEDASPYSTTFIGSDYLILLLVFSMLLLLTCVLVINKFDLGIGKLLRVAPPRGGRKVLANGHHARQF